MACLEGLYDQTVATVTTTIVVSLWTSSFPKHHDTQTTENTVSIIL